MGLTPAGSSRAWRRLRAACLHRDGYRCQVPVDTAGRIDPAGRPCLLPADTADHIVPRIRGGLDVLSNLRAACTPHNLAKGDRLDGDVPAPRPRRAAPGAGRAWDW